MRSCNTIVLCFVLVSAAAHAGPVQDTQFWLAGVATAGLSARVRVQGEIQGRWSNAAEGFSATNLRAVIGANVASGAMVWAGYQRQEGEQPGPNRIEQRSIQQLDLALGRFAGARLGSRTRLEQRFVGEGDAGWRVRQRLRLDRPLAGMPTEAFVAAEGFFALDRASWGQTPGIDRARFQLGLTTPVLPGVRFEAAYQAQWRNLDMSRDALDHVALGTFNFTF